MSADQARAEAPSTAPRSYFEQEAKTKSQPGPLVSKTGDINGPQAATELVRNGLPPELFEKRAVIALALRLEGYSYPEIEKMTGLSDGQVRYALRKSRAAGKLSDVVDIIENEAVPQAVENLRAALIDPKHANHWDATTETLHGRGVLRRYNNNKVDGAGEGRLPPLQIAIINPGGGEKLPAVIVNSEKGSVIGSPRFIESETD